MAYEDHDCPTCGKEYGSFRWVQRHHKQEHGEPVDNCTCNICGISFYHETGDRRTCEECDPREGENNPNYKNAKQTSECAVCGREFEYYPSEKYGKYCPEHSHNSYRLSGISMQHGYEAIRGTHCGEEYFVLHHRLLAVAEYGFDEVAGKVVHHKINIPWLNIPENLRPMENSEHTRLHQNQ